MNYWLARNSRENLDIAHDLAGARKLFEVQYFCSAKYKCRQQMIAQHYSWNSDPPVDPCNTCDNCMNSLLHNVQNLPDAKNDVFELVEVIRSLTDHFSEITPQNVIDVYTHAKTKEMKEKRFTESAAYQRQYRRKVLSTKELVHAALDDLILLELVEQQTVLQRPNEHHLTCNMYIRGVKGDAKSTIERREWVYRVSGSKLKHSHR